MSNPQLKKHPNSYWYSDRNISSLNLKTFLTTILILFYTYFNVYYRFHLILLYYSYTYSLFISIFLFSLQHIRGNCTYRQSGWKWRSHYNRPKKGWKCPNLRKRPWSKRTKRAGPTPHCPRHTTRIYRGTRPWKRQSNFCRNTNEFYIGWKFQF